MSVRSIHLGAIDSYDIHIHGSEGRAGRGRHRGSIFRNDTYFWGIYFRWRLSSGRLHLFPAHPQIFSGGPFSPVCDPLFPSLAEIPLSEALSLSLSLSTNFASAVLSGRELRLAPAFALITFLRDTLLLDKRIAREARERRPLASFSIFFCFLLLSKQTRLHGRKSE